MLWFAEKIGQQQRSPRTEGDVVERRQKESTTAVFERRVQGKFFNHRRLVVVKPPNRESQETAPSHVDHLEVEMLGLLHGIRSLHHRPLSPTDCHFRCHGIRPFTT